MIDLTEPIDFDAAIDKLSDKELHPTVLRSDEIMRRMDADLRDRSFFSAQVANADLLQGFKDSVDKIVKGKSDVATQRLELKKLLDAHGYSADPDKVGTLQDLRSNQRLNLILKTNVAMVRGYGQYQESMAGPNLIASPAQRLVRIGRRKVPRHWLAIWDNARLLLGNKTSALPSSKGLVALKGDPIWTEISDFGLPWPPFKFNSGMGVANVSYEVASDLGIIKSEASRVAEESRKREEEERKVREAAEKVRREEAAAAEAKYQAEQKAIREVVEVEKTRLSKKLKNAISQEERKRIVSERKALKIEVDRKLAEAKSDAIATKKESKRIADQNKDAASKKTNIINLPNPKAPSTIIISGPVQLPMNKGLAASVKGIDSSFLHVLLQMSAGLSLVGTELMLDDDDPVQNRSVDEVWEEIAA